MGGHLNLKKICAFVSAKREPEQWLMFFCLLNATGFISASFAVSLIFPNLSSIRVVAAVFFGLSMLLFLSFIKKGKPLNVLAWFVFGSGVYFGLGTIFGTYRVHPYTRQIFGDDNSFLFDATVINSISVFCVCFFGFLVWSVLRLLAPIPKQAQTKEFNVIISLFPVLQIAALCILSFGFLRFPTFESLALESIFQKAQLLLIAAHFLLGFFWSRLPVKGKIIGLTLLVLDLLLGVFAFTKFRALIVPLSFSIGFWSNKNSPWFIYLFSFFLIIAYIVLSFTIGLGRSHLEYHPSKNSVQERLMIINDVLTSIPKQKIVTLEDGAQVELEYRALFRSSNPATVLGRRFEITPIQGYLIKEYEDGRRGNTLADFWMTFIPRIIWRDKPVITHHGQELHKRYFSDPNQTSSSLAPTFSAEAYWNFGFLGLFCVSSCLGLVIGGLSYYSSLASSGYASEYFLVCVPVAIWSGFVESWIVSTYLGQFIIFLVLLIFGRCIKAVILRFYQENGQGLSAQK